MNKLQSVQLEILLEIDRVCKKNSIEYFLDAGTALGGFRHHGFIPWDDDIDIGMMRDDYNKFLELAPAELGDKFFLQTLKSDPGCPILFAKVRMNGTQFLENNTEGMNMHTGIWVDIFPYDFVPSHQDFRKKTNLNFWVQLFLTRKIPHKLDYLSGSLLKHYVLCGVRKILHCVLQVFPEKLFTDKINSIIESAAPEGEKKFVQPLLHSTTPVMEYSRLFPLSSCEFEKHYFPVVKDMDYYLTAIFGDYMTLPPEEKRVGHRPRLVKTE